MVGKHNRDTSSVTATPSTVTSSSAAFGRWAFGIGQPRRDRRGRTGIVKGRSRRGWPIPNAHRPKAADEDVTVDGVAVTNDVLRRYFPTIGLGELARNPFSCWVRSHSQPQDLAAIV